MADATVGRRTFTIKRPLVRFPVRPRLRNDSGQVVHTHVPRRRQSSLLYGVVKQRTFTFTVIVYGREAAAGDLQVALVWGS